MDEAALKKLLAEVRAGKRDVSSALDRLRHLPYENLSFARVDHHRHLRQGIPEVIFAENKSPDETAAIAASMLSRSGCLLITRASAHHRDAVASAVAGEKCVVDHNPTARTIVVSRKKPSTGKIGHVLILTAGTSDRPVAEEAAVTCRFLGDRVTEVHDVGVAGLHRLMDVEDKLRTARVLIVVAGMEGALPSVVGGLTDKPVIAVPTSVGYGTSLGGLTALFAMLNSCVPGIAVMNIDNGFGAACLAHRINTVR
jgi:NCAIR mutase (PurE)-related protein